MLQKYFKNLYQRTMDEAYSLAHTEMANALKAAKSTYLDCGAHNGYKYDTLHTIAGLEQDNYHGIEWNHNLAIEAQQKGLNVIQGDLNKALPFDDNSFNCVYGLSVLEHLLNPCQFLREAHRVLNEGGTLVILTPNISTLFTAALTLMGKMPSKGKQRRLNS